MKQSLFIFFLGCTLANSAQSVEVVSNTLSFPTTDELSNSMASIEVYNPGIYPATVTDVDLFTEYGIEPFTLTDTAFVLMPKDTQQLAVSFAPNHNIDYDMALVIKTESGFGHVAVQLVGSGAFSNTYYSSTQNLSDQALKTALKTKLAAGYTSLGYTTARDNMYGSIDNVAGDVTCVYTGRTATFNTRAGANSNQFNTEHTFPQGFFSQNEPMRSDIHHLYPTDVTSNSQRGNLPFGVVSGTPSWSVGGSKKGGSVFEPRDAQKGTTARAMMYFVIRYQDYSNHFSGQESILRTWHEAFPPSAADMSRNNAIANLQTARNPFIDYPQLADRIYSFTTNTSRPLVKNLYQSDDTIQLAQVGGRHLYQFVLYNAGTDDIQLSGFTLSDTSLYFNQGQPGTFTLSPGDVQTLSISYNAQVNYTADLTFTSDQNPANPIVVPIRSGTSIGLSEVMLPSFSMYPNPADAYFSLEYQGETPRELWIMDMQGRGIKATPEKRVFSGHLSKGIYVVKALYANGFSASQRLVIH